MTQRDELFLYHWAIGHIIESPVSISFKRTELALSSLQYQRLGYSGRLINTYHILKVKGIRRTQDLFAWDSQRTVALVPPLCRLPVRLGWFTPQCVKRRSGVWASVRLPQVFCGSTKLSHRTDENAFVTIIIFFFLVYGNIQGYLNFYIIF